MTRHTKEQVTSTESSSGKSQLDNFYDAAPLEPHLLYQGEVLLNVPILNSPMPPRWLLLRTQSGRRLDEALNFGKSVQENRVRVLDSNQSQTQWEEDGYDGDFAMALL